MDRSSGRGSEPERLSDFAFRSERMAAEIRKRSETHSENSGELPETMIDDDRRQGYQATLVYSDPGPIDSKLEFPVRCRSPAFFRTWQASCRGWIPHPFAAAERVTEADSR